MSQTQPRVSAIITAYNCAEFVGEAIESVLGQTRPVDEIVVVDDGSTDDTAAVMQAYAARGVRYVYQDNQGAGGARNRGIEETTGELVTFLDGDDTWYPDKTAVQLAYLAAHPATGLVSGERMWWRVSTNQRNVKRYALPPGKDLRREILVQNVVGNPSMTMIRRSVIERVGLFNRSLRWGEDWEFFIRVAYDSPIGFVHQPVIVYRWHPGNLSHDRMWMQLDCFLNISRRAIATYASHWHAVLLARSISRIEFLKAERAFNDSLSMWRQIYHAGRSVVIYPFENTFSKVRVLTRSVFPLLIALMAMSFSIGSLALSFDIDTALELVALVIIGVVICFSTLILFGRNVVGKARTVLREKTARN
jgi:glycosyltransferase involved in cell wall biosynthesis